ncbi:MULTISPECIES: SDR family NAD(P)-dependent oxidoreductase [unclassified Sphingobium]|uniref:SDR family NAD(P)-dependent oxidoreductase n=2 Tax=Sphingobium TaxID=165695 RepID=UPI002225B0E4|nr:MULTISPECIES: SDR family oxidoreductase [unclassified Sphingobium]MCW2399399.1 NAD(P)-dependent dehydrogenase (short-subunit alcohol dehydrogenase family) [Sphingobium sp. B2D3C]MCW2413530.1 NAD(P)-dependent dehydrogenase (short-subunit alcohol dehydrogenase family) [Sphingobium sp. B8D3D]
MTNMKNAPDLTGKTALVTGGTRGLGLGLARALGRQGAKLVLVGRDPDTGAKAVAALAAEGIDAQAVAADVSDGAGLRDAVAPLGAIDLLVCVAGVGVPRRPVWEATPEDYRACFDINVLGVMNAMAAVMPSMVERGEGRVVAIGGTYGHKGNAGFAIYSASKWALRGLVKSAALDAAPYGVRVNLISPGGVEGERLSRMFRESAQRNGEPEDAPLKRFLATTVLGRLVTEEDVAAALFHLVGPAGNMITGQDIVVDAGTVI